MTELQIQARALGDPTRHGIFRQLAGSDRPVSAGELAERFGINHTAVRQHLSRLVDAGLVIGTLAAPTGRGRPPVLYSVDPACDARWGVVGPYERLSVLLAEMIRSGDSAFETGRRDGRRTVTEVDPRFDAVDALADLMRRQGFEPETQRDGSTFEIVLGTCPFASAALADRETVCRLHHGIAVGAAEGVGGISVDDLVADDPRRARCRLQGTIDRS